MFNLEEIMVPPILALLIYAAGISFLVWKAANLFKK